MKFIKMMVALLLMVSSSAQSAWLTTVRQDKATNIKEASLAGELNNKTGIIVLCTGNYLSFSYLEPFFGSEEPLAITIAMTTVVDSNSPLKTTGIAKLYDKNILGIISEDRAFITHFIKQLIKASNQVVVGLDAQGQTTSLSGDVVNARQSVKDFMTACEIKL